MKIIINLGGGTSVSGGRDIRDQIKNGEEKLADYKDRLNKAAPAEKKKLKSSVAALEEKMGKWKAELAKHSKTSGKKGKRVGKKAETDAITKVNGESYKPS